MLEIYKLFGNRARNVYEHTNGKLLQEIADELTTIFGDLISKGADIEVKFEDAKSVVISSDISSLSTTFEIKFPRTYRTISGFVHENISIKDGIIRSEPHILIYSNLDPNPLKSLYPDHFISLKYEFKKASDIAKCLGDVRRSKGFAKDMADIVVFVTSKKPTNDITAFRGFRIIPSVSDGVKQQRHSRLD